VEAGGLAAWVAGGLDAALSAEDAAAQGEPAMSANAEPLNLPSPETDCELCGGKGHDPVCGRCGGAPDAEPLREPELEALDAAVKDAQSGLDCSALCYEQVGEKCYSTVIGTAIHNDDDTEAAGRLVSDERGRVLAKGDREVTIITGEFYSERQSGASLARALVMLFNLGPVLLAELRRLRQQQTEPLGDPELDALDRAAEAELVARPKHRKPPQYDKLGLRPEAAAYHRAADPPTIRALIERCRRAERLAAKYCAELVEKEDRQAEDIALAEQQADRIKDLEARCTEQAEQLAEVKRFAVGSLPHAHNFLRDVAAWLARYAPDTAETQEGGE